MSLWNDALDLDTHPLALPPHRLYLQAQDTLWIRSKKIPNSEKQGQSPPLT